MFAGTEYLTSNAQIAYPFAEDASGLARTNIGTHGTSATLPISVIVDAVAFVPDVTVTLYLRSIIHVGGSVFQFTFVGGVSPIVANFDISTLDVSKTYNVVLLSDGINPYQVKLVVRTADFTAFLAGCTADDFGTTLPFETRTLNRMRPRLESLQLYEGDGTTPISSLITGRVMFVDGYNSEYAQQVVNDDTTEITLDLSPGGGLGVYPCTPGPGMVNNRFMGLVPDSAGNIIIAGGEENCYSIIPGTTIQIHGSCVACCSCEDYVNVTKALRNLLNHSQLALIKLNEGHDTYQAGVETFNTEISIRYIGPKLSAYGYGGSHVVMPVDPKHGIPSGSTLWCTVIMELQNNTSLDIKINSVSMVLTPVNNIKTISWVYGDSGGQVDDIASLASAAPNPIERGKRLAIAVRAKASNSDPLVPTVWSATITMDVYVKPPEPAVPYTLTLIKTISFS